MYSANACTASLSAGTFSPMNTRAIVSVRRIQSWSRIGGGHAGPLAGQPVFRLGEAVGKYQVRETLRVRGGVAHGDRDRIRLAD